MASRGANSNSGPESMRATLDRAKAAMDARTYVGLDERIDRRVSSLLGHHRKFFEGTVSVEKLGPLYGGYGTFLPTEVKGNSARGEIIFNGGNIYDHLQPAKFKWYSEYMNAISIARHSEVLPPREGYPPRFIQSLIPDMPIVPDVTSNGGKSVIQNGSEHANLPFNQDIQKANIQKMTAKNILNKSMLPPPTPLKNSQKSKSDPPQQKTDRPKADGVSGKPKCDLDHIKIKGEPIELKMINFPLVIKGFYSEFLPHSVRTSPLDDDCKSYSQTIKSPSSVSLSKNLKTNEYNESQSIKKESTDDIEEGEVRESEDFMVSEGKRNDKIEAKDETLQRKERFNAKIEKGKPNIVMRNEMNDKVSERASVVPPATKRSSEVKERKDGKGKDFRPRRDYEDKDTKDKIMDKDEKPMDKERDKREALKREDESKKAKLEEEKKEKRREEEERKKLEEEKIKMEEKQRKLEERIKREEEEKRRRLEEKERKMEETKRRKAEEEKSRKESEERRKKEEEEKRRIEEEEERKRKEEMERKRKTEEQKRRKEEEEKRQLEEERKRREEEEERRKKKEYERRKAQEETEKKEREELAERKRQKELEELKAKEEEEKTERMKDDELKRKTKDKDSKLKEERRRLENETADERGRNRTRSGEGDERRAVKDKSLEREKVSQKDKGREFYAGKGVKNESNERTLDDDASNDEYDKDVKLGSKDTSVLLRSRTLSKTNLRNAADFSSEPVQQFRRKSHDVKTDEHLDDESQKKSNLLGNEAKVVKSESIDANESSANARKEKQKKHDGGAYSYPKSNSKSNSKDVKRRVSQEVPSKSLKNEKQKALKESDSLPVKLNRDLAEPSHVGLVHGSSLVPAPQPGVTDSVPTTQELDNWVECDACKLWRLLPPSVNPDELPDNWTCSMSHWMPDLASCSIPYEVTVNAVYASLGFALPFPVQSENLTLVGSNAKPLPVHTNKKDNFSSKKQKPPPRDGKDKRTSSDVQTKKKSTPSEGRGAAMALSPTPSHSASMSPSLSGMTKNKNSSIPENETVGQKKLPPGKKLNDRDVHLKASSKLPPWNGGIRERSVELAEDGGEGREGRERRESHSKSPPRVVKNKHDDFTSLRKESIPKKSLKRNSSILIEDEERKMEGESGRGEEEEDMDHSRKILENNDGENLNSSKRLKLDRKEKDAKNSLDKSSIKREVDVDEFQRSSIKERQNEKSTFIIRNENDKSDKKRKNQERKEVSFSPSSPSSPSLTPMKKTNARVIDGHDAREKDTKASNNEVTERASEKERGRGSIKGLESPEKGSKRKDRRGESYEEVKERDRDGGSAKKRPRPSSLENKAEVIREDRKARDRDIPNKDKDGFHRLHQNHSQNQNRNPSHDREHEDFSNNKGDGNHENDDHANMNEKSRNINPSQSQPLPHGNTMKFEKNKYERGRSKPSDVKDNDTHRMKEKDPQNKVEEKVKGSKNLPEVLSNQQKLNEDNQTRGVVQNHPINANSSTNLLNAKTAMSEAIALKRQGNEKTEGLERTDLYMRSSLKFLESIAHDESQRALYVSTAAMLEHCGKMYENLNQIGGAIIAYKCAAILRSRFLHFQTIPSTSDQAQVIAFFEQTSHDVIPISTSSKAIALENGNSKTVPTPGGKEKSSMTILKDDNSIIQSEIAVPFRKSLLLPSSYMIKSAKELYAMNTAWNKAANLSVLFSSSTDGGTAPSTIGSLKSLGENNGLNPLKDSIKLAYRALSDFERL